MVTRHSSGYVIASVIVVIAIVGTAESAKAADRIRPKLVLSLSDAVFLGLRNNTTIRSAYIGRVAEKFGLVVAEDRFTPQVEIGGGASREWARSGMTDAESVATNVSALAPTGATFDFVWSNTAIDAPGQSTRTSEASVSVVQPLLRGAGREVNYAPITSAQLQERINQLRLKATASEVISQIIVAYRELVKSEHVRVIAQASLARSKALVETTTALIGAGRMAAFDAVQVEADVEKQKLAVLSAESDIETNRLALLNLLDLDLNVQLSLAKAETPRLLSPKLDVILPTALRERPDYASQVHVVEQARLGLHVARNEELWDVSLFSSGRAAVTSAATPFASKDSDVSSDATVGISFRAPLNDLSRKQAVVSANTSLQTAELQLHAIENGIRQQLRRSISDLNIYWRQIEIARRVSKLSARAVEVEQDKLKAGRSSSFQVRTIESELRSAQSDEVGATIAYLNALTQLDLQLGTTLETWRITLAD